MTTNKYLIRFAVAGNVALAAASAARILNELKDIIVSQRTNVTFTDFGKNRPGIYQGEITFRSEHDLVGVARFFKDAPWKKPGESAYVIAPEGYPRFGILKMNINQAWEGPSPSLFGPDPDYKPTNFESLSAKG